jgi:hypothetical protein
VVKGKALYPEQCCPSPFHALPNALGLKVESKGDVPYILNAINEKIVELGMEGRIATWTAPIAMNFIRAGSEYAMDFAEGKFEDKQDIERAKAALHKYAGDVRVRAFDDEKTPHFLMVVGESIIFGK